MSEEKGGSAARRPPLRQDRLVDDLRSAPQDPSPEVVELHGFLGRDGTDGYWRLYLNSGLDSYLRIAEADIVASRQADAEASSLEPSVVFVCASATIEHVHTSSADLHADFLRGPYSVELAAEPSGDCLPASRPRLRRGRFTPEVVLRYPQTYPYFCRPQITIEQQTCFCTVFCPV
ncbi:hypothetical protein O7626_16785 [Micromonospora sp. WMMD1102]|uniref:hypothetical protein n=1 Tax=Micromonospora sp. WMMD1102 TaxID=3016105 RepID=UPI0024153B6A|nr:hypothetical protein [Micromonospora sp. WMMD1102]MDG4787571.1 hypothetical protein [Micromonospora sp. WMMD1102]